MGNAQLIKAGGTRGKPLLKNKNLKLIADLEARYKVVDEESFFKNLVNPSLNKSKPYYGWARYREAYSGELVKELIRRSSLDPKKHFIYDPMSGSGSTLLAATELLFDSIGNDINPYAVDISNAKLYRYKESSLKIVEKFVENKDIPNLKGRSARERSMANCCQFFENKHAKLLQKIINQISLVQDSPAQMLLSAVWLTVLEDCSNRKKDGNGLATRPTKVVNIWSHFQIATRNVLKDLRSLPLPKGTTSLIIKDSAFDASKIVENFSKKVEKKLGAIIFSPPYANSFDYFESYKLELLCGYYTPAELIEARKAAIRSFRKGYGYNLISKNKNVENLCKDIKSRIPLKEKRTGVVDNRSRLVSNLLVGYFEDMGKTLHQFSNSMPKGSYCYIVVDQSAYLGVIVPSDLLLAELGEEHGLKVEKLIRCRTAKTSAQQLKEYPYLRTMLRESIVVLRKP